MSGKKEDNWENDAPLDVRTKLGLSVLFLIFKVVKPYRFGHEFQKEIDAIGKLISEAK